MPVFDEPDENSERRGAEGAQSPSQAEMDLARNLRAAGFL